LDINNDSIIGYYKTTEDMSNLIIVIVNLDPMHKQAGNAYLPLNEFGIDEDKTYLLNDLISNDKYIRQGSWNYIELDPNFMPVHIFRLQKRLRREYDFDYFM
jgi:starch synthase (maltosyl-transferring)